MRFPRLAALAAAIVATAPALGAQVVPDEGDDSDVNAQAAYFALTMTPLGGLPPAITLRDAGLAPRAFGFRFQFGYMDDEGDISHRNFAGGIDLPFGRATMGLTAGYQDLACDTDEAEDAGIDLECKGTIGGAVSVSAPLLSSPLGGTGESSNTFNLGIDGMLGFGSGDLVKLSGDDGFGNTISLSLSHTSYGATVGLPLSLVARSPGLVIVPMLRPAFGYGHARIEGEFTGEPSEEQTESGTRFMLGGGVGLFFPNRGLGLNVGMQKVFIEDGKTVIGAGLTFGR